MNTDTERDGPLISRLLASASTVTIKAFTSPPSPASDTSVPCHTNASYLCTWTNAFSFVSQCVLMPGSHGLHAKRRRLVPQSSVDNEGKRRKKERVVLPLETLRAIHLPRVPLYTFPTPSPSVHTLAHVNSFTPFGYVFRTLGSLSESANPPSAIPPTYASFSSLRDSVCAYVCVCVCVGHPCVWPSLLSPCARFHPFLSRSLSLGPHECPRKYRTWKRGRGGGKALEFFARILLFRKAFDGVSGSRVIRAI